MKTPEEIKKGLECCYSPVEPMLRCEACPYYGSIVCKMRLHTDALVYIQQLEAQNAELVKQVERIKADKKKIMETAEILSNAVTRLERERDAAVKILTDIAHYDDWFGGVDICVVCKKEKCKECGNVNGGFERRGVPEKEREHDEVDAD